MNAKNKYLWCVNTKRAAATYKMRKKLREMIQFRNTLPTCNIHPFSDSLSLVQSVILTTKKCLKVKSPRKKRFFLRHNGIIPFNCIRSVRQRFLQCGFGGTAVSAATGATIATATDHTNSHHFANG